MDELHARMEVQRGDITRCQVDAVVNAANTTLLGGSGRVQERVMVIESSCPEEESSRG